MVALPRRLLVLLVVVGSTLRTSSRVLRSRQTVRAAVADDGDESECSCDCCLATRQSDPAVSSAYGMSCTPRAPQGVDGGAEGDGDGDCGAQCAAPESLVKKFHSQGSSVEYERFCLSACSPGSSAVNVLCVDAGNDDDDGQGAGAANGQGQGVDAASVPQKAVPVEARAADLQRAMAQTMSEAASSARAETQQVPAGGISLPLAKGDMLAAEQHAKAAGEAARIAKETYEQVMAAPRSAAEEAGKATLSEIKREAGEQAKEALLIRLKYEEKAKNTAIKKALAKAMVYHNAMNRDLDFVSTWEKRANQFAAAAGQRKGMAMADAAQANKYKKLEEWTLAREWILQAHQAMSQAKEFARTSQSAYEQAVAINKGIKWFIYAEQAGAANMLAKSMPADVPPPDMPPLP